MNERRPTTATDRVTPERWNEAQDWERQAWIDTQRRRARFGKNVIWRALSALRLVQRHRGDDWNAWWAKQFDGYRFLPDSVDNAIELGCGPYTNMRLVEKACRARHVVLSDPLIRTYITFVLTYVADAYRSGSCMLDDHPIEECPYADNFFDVVVMINVLDHVRDAGRCVERAMAITRPGGHLIIGQELSNEDDIRSMEGQPGDIGHPIKLDHVWMGSRLAPHFEPVINKVLSREDGRDPSHHYGTMVFAGRKRAQAAS